MGKTKGPITMPGAQGFVLLASAKPSRGKVVELSRQLTGAKSNPDFTLRTSAAAQLGDHLARRVQVTNQLLRLAAYFAFVFRPDATSFYVQGAAVQHGSGNSTAPERDAKGRVVYVGLDAAHVRLGTFTLNGDPVCTAWPRRILELAEERKVPKRDVPRVFRANCTLANRAMMLDAATELTDAMTNRVSGQIEGFVHAALRTMVPTSVATDAGTLREWADRLNERFPQLVGKAIRHFVKGRLRELQAAPSREAVQKPGAGGVDEPMYATEGEFLRALLSLIEQPGSDFWRPLEHVQALARVDTAEEIREVTEARREVAGGQGG